MIPNEFEETGIKFEGTIANKLNKRINDKTDNIKIATETEMKFQEILIS